MDYYSFTKQKLRANFIALFIAIVYLAYTITEYICTGEFDYCLPVIALCLLPSLCFRIYSYYKLEAFKKQEESLEAVTWAEHRQGHLINIVSDGFATLALAVIFIIHCFKKDPHILVIVGFAFLMVFALVAAIFQICDLKKTDKEFKQK